ncbi:MAG: helix-hairpin-helix domain-containing protein [Bacteroidota bacterium]|nr:helix-hairpin-helix domain-containing protein [Bacteroidota bacterium]
MIYPLFIEPANIQLQNIALVEEEIDEKRHSLFENKNGNDTKGTVFPFDPNTITKEELVKLGLKERTAETFIKFRNRGFVFKQKEDLQKIYGISPKLYSKLEPYILINNSTSRANKKTASTIANSSGKKLELNSADSLALLELKGIGPGYAKRILKYRRLLGGFTSIQQVKEIYGMTDELYNLVVSQCTINSSTIKKININTVDFKTLNKHPYIDYELTKRIFLIKKNGKITEENIAEAIEDDELTAKVKPYLEF